jgi:hypothetical protein
MVNKRSALFRRDISWPARTQRAQPPPGPFDLGVLQDPAAVPPPPVRQRHHVPPAAGPAGSTGNTTWAPEPADEQTPAAATTARWATISLAELRSDVVRDSLMNRWTPDSAITTRSRPPLLSASTPAPHPTSYQADIAALGATPLRNRWTAHPDPRGPCRSTPSTDPGKPRQRPGAYPVPMSTAKPCIISGTTPHRHLHPTEPAATSTQPPTNSTEPPAPRRSP